MPTYEVSSDLNPMGRGEIKAGEMVIEPDLVEMVKKTHTLFYTKTNILAYSYQHNHTTGTDKDLYAITVPDGESIFAYKFTVRRFIPQQELELHIWCEKVDIDVEYQDSDSAWNSAALTASSGSAVERLVIPITDGIWSDDDGGGNDPNDTRRLRLRVSATATAEGQSGRVYGMALIEKPLSPTFTTETDEDAGEIFINSIDGMEGFIHQDASSVGDNASFNVMSLRMLLRNIETIAERKRRGCAVVFPYPLRYALSSAFWRGDGPFQWKAAPWCGTATMIADCEQFSSSEPNSSGDLRLLIGAFSDAVKHDVRTGSALRDVIYHDAQAQWIKDSTGTNVVIRNDDSLNNCTKMMTVKVRAGEWNNLFLAYRGQHDNVPTASWTNGHMTAKFTDWNEGCFDTRFRETSEDSPFTSAQWFINGMGVHFLMRATQKQSGGGDSAPVYVPKPEEPGVPDYSSIPGEEEDQDKYSIFDVACFRGAGETYVDENDEVQTSNQMHLTASPSPPFSDPELGNIETFTINGVKHGWGRLNSLWINDECNGADLYRFAVANRPPSQSLVYNYLQILNNMLDHSWTVNGIRGVNDGRHETYFSPTPAAKGGNGCNYFIMRSLQEYYGKPTNPTYALAAQFPITVQLDPASETGVPKRTYTKVRFRVHYRVFAQSLDNDGTGFGRDPGESVDEDSEEVRLKLLARAFMSDSPAVNQMSRIALTLDKAEIDIKDKISSKSDVQSFTAWDAYVSSTKSSANNGTIRFQTLNQVAWPSEIIGESYPWDIFEVEATLPTEGDIPSDSEVRLGPLQEYGFPTWINLELSLFTYLRDVSGTSAQLMSGGSVYNLVIAGISCVPSLYPLEEV